MNFLLFGGWCFQILNTLVELKNILYFFLYKTNNTWCICAHHMSVSISWLTTLIVDLLLTLQVPVMSQNKETVYIFIALKAVLELQTSGLSGLGLWICCRQENTVFSLQPQLLDWYIVLIGSHKVKGYSRKPRVAQTTGLTWCVIFGLVSLSSSYKGMS